MNQIFNRRDQTAMRQSLRGEIPPAERILWRHLRDEKCGVKFRRQASVDSFVVDFYCPELHLAIEIDGVSHENAEAAKYDAARQIKIESHGIRFLRFTNAQVFRQLPDVMETILGTIGVLKAERLPAGGGYPLRPPGTSPSNKGRKRGTTGLDPCSDNNEGSPPSEIPDPANRQPAPDICKDPIS